MTPDMAAETSQPERGPEGEPVRSILDTDLYKLTMQQAVLEHYPNAVVSYRFTNRSMGMRFTKDAVDAIQQSVNRLAELRLTQPEREWLERNCHYLKAPYLDYLTAFRFKPDSQVKLTFRPADDGKHGDLEIQIDGYWHDAILYEVPLMAIISETYFKRVDTQWSMRGQRALAKQKAQRLVSAGCRFAEFGTRRRRSFYAQQVVMEGLLQGEAAAGGAPGKLLGTSNVHFARLFNVPPSGTMAHEWIMSIAALSGYDAVNLRALQAWDQVYSPPFFTPGHPGEDLTIALTDTFSTRVFFDDLLCSDKGKDIARRWRGLRQDSGDPKTFARRAKEMYDSIGIDAKTKVVIYSDALTVDKCLDLLDFSKEIGIGAGFGVGTHLTNDFRRSDDVSDEDADLDGELPAAGATSKALNIVIKLRSIDGRQAVKISDDLTKNTGDAEEVQFVKRRFGLTGDVDSVEDA